MFLKNEPWDAYIFKFNPKTNKQILKLYEILNFAKLQLPFLPCKMSL